MAERKFVQIADSEAVTQIRDDWAVFKISSIRILDKATSVAVRISQVLSEGISRQKIESVGEALVQRGLERVVKHLQLRIIKRQNSRHVRLLVEVSSTEVRDAVTRIGPAEICVEDLQRLVQIAGFVIPKMVGTSSNVADLSYEVVLELMLDAQVPFHDAGDDTLWSGGLYRSADVNGVSYRQGGWKAGRNKLAV